MKLLAAPLVFAVARQAFELQRRLPLGHLFFVNAGPLPESIDDGITKRAAVRCADLSSVVKIFVVITVATEA